MAPGLLGKKIGMTQVWDAAEVLRPATVLQVGPCTVLQVKTPAKDKYSAIQLGFDEARTRRKHGKGERRKAVERRGANRAEIGHAKKAGATPKRFVHEMRVEPDHSFQAGQELTVELFKDVAHVDIIGVTKGKGFQGTVKRHRFSRGPESHGSMNVRAPGSIGASSDPSRVWPGTRMAGHMGAVRQTESSLRVLRVDPARHLLLVNGAVPGANGSYVQVLPARRKKLKQSAAAPTPAEAKS
jgi:large subunit ribosomal protein L3